MQASFKHGCGCCAPPELEGRLQRSASAAALAGAVHTHCCAAARPPAPRCFGGYLRSRGRPPGPRSLMSSCVCKAPAAFFFFGGGGGGTACLCVYIMCVRARAHVRARGQQACHQRQERLYQERLYQRQERARGCASTRPTSLPPAAGAALCTGIQADKPARYELHGAGRALQCADAGPRTEPKLNAIKLVCV